MWDTTHAGDYTCNGAADACDTVSETVTVYSRLVGFQQLDFDAYTSAIH